MIQPSYFFHFIEGRRGDGWVEGGISCLRGGLLIYGTAYLQCIGASPGISINKRNSLVLCTTVMGTNVKLCFGP